MDYKIVEEKWRKKWSESELYKFDKEDIENKYYMLEMFSYPSGAKLHLGHWWNYALSDSYARYKRMNGYNVFHPMGFDAFGLPAENYALKTGVHPKDSTEKNIEVMEEQLKKIGGTFDWDYEIKTCDEEYYKWTQWLFLKLYEKGLAYKKNSPINWCDSCNTVLANEQVIDGKCERCSSEVVKKKMNQWFFKITDYCEKLLAGLEKIDWPEKTKLAQRNWIGRSEGAEIDFILENGEKLVCFTSRADTLHGVKWVAIAPEHDMVEKLTTEEKKKEVADYIYLASKKDDIERTSTVSEKTGVFTGSYVTNPINGEKVPVHIADYVLGHYGTGAVMGVPAHDDRDYLYAEKYNIEVLRVVDGADLPFTSYGKLVNSGRFNGLSSEEAKTEIVKELEKEGCGRSKINYKLRDWSVGRQRYWGCPIPMVYCDHCGEVPVPEKDLPVRLVYDVEFKPSGKSPLESSEEFMITTCPKCGGKAKRDGDTLDTFTCSSWYQLRYPNANNHEKPFEKDWTDKICPVDKYVGGFEHATSHLLYSRFITKFLNDEGYISFDEPFLSLVHQGVILGTDGNKMSKSKGNTVSADEIVDEFGSDTLRAYLMFGFNYLDGGPWSNDGIKSIAKFLERIENLILEVYEKSGRLSGKILSENMGKEERELEYNRHFTIKSVTRDFDKFGFNTSIARIMELNNAINKYLTNEEINHDLLKDVVKDMMKLLAPCIPHIMEELWERVGGKYSIFNEAYPKFDDSKIVKDEIEIAVQINSKIVARENVKNDAEEEEVLESVKAIEKIAAALNGKTIVKTVFIKNRLINIIVR